MLVALALLASQTFPVSAPLSRHQRIVVDLSIRILRAAMTRSTASRVDTVEVRLALRCLLGH
jgi:hypothetical protein